MELNTNAPAVSPGDSNQIWRLAWWLALITIFYNLVEGLVSTFLGFQDETLALFGFGVDSFIEVISAVGIAHMITRIRRHPDLPRDEFEKTALRITGAGFYLLTAGLVVTAGLNLIQNHHPETTSWGVVISLVSIGTMTVLIRFKMREGRRLNSQPLIADAKCTRTCLQMSVVLLVSSAVYEMTGIGYLDSLGALMIAYLAFNEGREAFDKAAGKASCGCEDDSCPA